MRVVELLLLLVLVVPSYPAPAIPDDLQRQINAIYERSVRECGKVFDRECAKRQFYLNFRYEVIGDQDRVVGHPGPIIPPSSSSR